MSSRIIFPSPLVARLEAFAAPTVSKADDILIETDYSIVSAGTELACRQGTESWAPLPFCPGYGSVGRVTHVGSSVTSVKPGDRVLTYGKHAKHAVADVLVVPVPSGLDSVEAVFARIAAVAITAVRASEVELGDSVAVIGLGLVGNLAAQLFALSGAQVIGIDPSPTRRKQAEACGISVTLAPHPGLKTAVSSLTAGRLCETVVDATGLSSVIVETAPQLVAPQGEIILLGSPRSPHSTDITPFLSQLHLCRPTAQVKGALEWRYPIAEEKNRFHKHSMERNVRQILDLLAAQKLVVKPLISHLVSPALCQEAYDGLANQRDTYTGVVFDWSRV